MEQETTMTREKILYDAAVQLMREADDVETYRLAEKLFRRIPQWKDALEKANACLTFCLSWCKQLWMR